MDDKRDEAGFVQQILENLNKAAQNALEVARFGRLSDEVRAPYTVERTERVYRLRRYAAVPAGVGSQVRPACSIVLVPPLMLTAEIYDIAPEGSAVGVLTSAGVDTWVVDFGAPEDQEGGLERTLDDHVKAVSQAVDHVRQRTGQDVHLAGYSQGGMFSYQTAALRRGEGLRSLITFGSPVDVHRNLPGVGEEVAERFIESVSGGVRSIIDSMEALPAALSSNGFRLLSARKEARQFMDFVGNLHDRDALQSGENSRLFLRGDGFVAWPGPALRAFFDQFVVENRLSSGGFVIDGKTLTLADITCPILYFVGFRDEFARPPSVRAVREAAVNTESYEVGMRAGHFGLVVGSKAMNLSWPTVIDWMLWHEDKGPRPDALEGGEAEVTSGPIQDVIEQNFEDAEYNARLLVDTAKGAAAAVRRRLDGASHTLTAMFDNMRYQVPRIARLERVQPDTAISPGLALSERAAEDPDGTFFLFAGRAYSYREADRRVNAVVRGLIECGVKQNQRVGVMMDARPTYLSIYTALSRLGAVAVLLSPDERRVALGKALLLGEVEVLITDPENAAKGRDAFDGPVLTLGGGAGPRTLPEGVRDMERIDPDKVEVPEDFTPNPGRAADLAMVIFTAGGDEQPRAARITNRRWAVAAYGAAAASSLTHNDTVYCCMPLHHAAGLLVSVGGALVGGARLALADGFEPEVFWTEVRRYGASVVYYAGEMCRALVDAPSQVTDASNPVRLFAGSGMRMDVWKRLKDRFHVDVLEFYATTEGNAVLANVSGSRVGSLGRPLPGSTRMAIAAFDFDKEEFIRDRDGWLTPCFADQPGVLIARVDAVHPMAAFDGYLDDKQSRRRLVRDAFEAGDVWFVTGDVLRQDTDGYYWFVDRAADMVRTEGGPVSTTHIEDVLYELPEIKHAMAFATDVPSGEHQMPVAAVVVRDGYKLDAATLVKHIEKRLDPPARPRFVRTEDGVRMSVGFRPIKADVQKQGVPVAPSTLRYDSALHLYEPLTEDGFATTVAQAGGGARDAVAPAAEGESEG